ncbi:MAG: hypothetical protein OXU20_14240 [Myxococcales bacterium]|nr:hypothetical protein [Myxococcales bacterium]MDD9971155.1 hypothetical protein [Myxococcales bacterium]
MTREHERIRFHTPDGRELLPVPQHRLPEGTGASELERTHEQLGLVIDAGTAVTRWNGDRMDVPWAVEGLCHVTPTPQPHPHGDERSCERPAKPQAPSHVC